MERSLGVGGHLDVDLGALGELPGPLLGHKLDLHRAGRLWCRLPVLLSDGLLDLFHQLKLSNNFYNFLIVFQSQFQGTYAKAHS